jgi:hypothetical protein
MKLLSATPIEQNTTAGSWRWLAVNDEQQQSLKLAERPPLAAGHSQVEFPLLVQLAAFRDRQVVG